MKGGFWQVKPTEEDEKDAPSITPDRKPMPKV
jgi:hypothetical protein